jgi:dihydrofolate reductase
MNLSLIVAMTDQGVIGRAGGLPWRLSADLQRFKRLTMGRAILMGRKTWDSLGRALPGRRSIVLSGNRDFHPPGAEVVANFDDALDLVWDDDEAFVIGGADLFRQALPLARRWYLTRVHADVAGDTYFPEYDKSEWRLVESESHAADARNEYPCTFEVYERARIAALPPQVVTRTPGP